MDYKKCYNRAFVLDIEGSVGLMSRIDTTILRGPGEYFTR